MEKPYDFQWNDLGDLAEGRPHLGATVPVAVYRLMQFTFKDVLGKELGRERTARIFVRAGTLAGREFCRNVLNVSLPLAEFMSELQNRLIELKIGVLRIEQADPDHLRFTLTVAEDLDCSGLPIMGETVCDYDEGFIAGIFQEYSGREFIAREVDCWATGDRTCRFQVHPK